MYNDIDPDKLIITIQIAFFTISSALIVKIIFKNIFKKIAKKTEIKLDDKIIYILENPTFITLLLVGLRIIATRHLRFPNYYQIILNVFYSLLTLIWGWALEKIIHYFYSIVESKTKGSKKTRDNLFTLLENITSVIILIIQGIIILSIWKINTMPLLTSAGIVSVVIGFAAKDSIANFFGGVSVFFDQPYKIGDYVIVKNKYRGKVINIGMRSKKIKTRNNILVTVPNSVMVTDFVINESGFDSKLRIRIPLGVSYDTDLDKAEKVILNILKSNSNILQKPKPRILYRKFGNSAIKLEAIGTIKKPAKKGIVTHTLIKDINEKLKKENIKIPNPQRDVHIYQK